MLAAAGHHTAYRTMRGSEDAHDDMTQPHAGSHDEQPPDAHGGGQPAPDGAAQPGARPGPHPPPVPTAPARVDFDLRLLGDPDTDPNAHQREWRRLVEHYAPRLDGYFADRIPERVDRDDLLQHVWYKAMLHVRSLPNATVLWNWLRRVGENRLTDVARSGAVALRHAEAHAAELRHELEAGGQVDAREEMVDLDALDLEGDVGRRFAALSEADRQLVMLVIEGVPHETIAARLGLPSAAASRQRWSRLRRSLRGP